MRSLGSGFAVLCAAVFATLVSGCAPMGSAEDSNASRAALEFARSLHTPPRACALLAPATLSELEENFGPCDRSLPDQHLPVDTEVLRVDVYGKDAVVRLDRDVVFLARFSDGWRVTAAGCVPRAGRPFNCTIKGQ